MRFSYIFIIVALVFFGCQEDQKTKKGTKQNTIQNYPSVSDSHMQELVDKTISIDIIAYELGVSMTYSERSSILPVLGFITKQPAEIVSTCKPVGRISFMFDTGVGQEADMYLHKGCNYFVWFENGKEKYSNRLTDEGNDFLTRFMPENPADLKIPKSAIPKEDH